MEFPLFRKYSNNLSYFLIESESKFIEYKLNPKGIEVHEIKARILPERNFIQDMIELKDGHWQAVKEVEFKEFLKINH